MANISNIYIQEVLNNPEIYINDYIQAKKIISKSTAIYRGEPIDFLYMPKFFDEITIEKFRQIIEMTMKILYKVIDKYLDDISYRKLFPFSKELEELIMVEHGYDSVLPIVRLDFFYNENNKEFKFCEFNADGTSAMNEDRELVNVLSETILFKKMIEEYKISSFELFDSWIDELLVIYKNSSFEVKESPTIAIVDFNESSTIEEFKIFKKYLEKRNHKTFIVDVRELKYDNSNLYYKGNKIDIVYRRLVTSELDGRIDEIKDFKNACLEGKVCIIGPIKSQIIHNKVIFKILHMEDTFEFLTRDEVDFIKKHIPFTEDFTTRKFNINEIVKNKDRWILKPYDLYGSKGVYAGLDFTINQWEEKVKKCINNQYLIQEYNTPFENNFVKIENNNLTIEKFRNITGIYVYNGKMKGILSRVGQKAVISSLNNGYTLPTFQVGRK